MRMRDALGHMQAHQYEVVARREFSLLLFCRRRLAAVAPSNSYVRYLATKVVIVLGCGLETRSNGTLVAGRPWQVPVECKSFVYFRRIDQ